MMDTAWGQILRDILTYLSARERVAPEVALSIKLINQIATTRTDRDRVAELERAAGKIMQDRPK